MNGLLINDLLSLLLDIPPVLAAQWAAWFVVGLVLSIWSRREKMRLIVHADVARHTSGVRSTFVERPPRPANRPAPVAPPPAADVFGELEAMLDAHDQSMHRTPGDVLPAPQSLP